MYIQCTFVYMYVHMGNCSTEYSLTFPGCQSTEGQGLSCSGQRTHGAPLYPGPWQSSLAGHSCHGHGRTALCGISEAYTCPYIHMHKHTCAVYMYMYMCITVYYTVAKEVYTKKGAAQILPSNPKQQIF